MRIFVLSLILASLVLTGCQTFVGSGNVITEERQTSEFDGVSLSGTGELTIIQAEEYSLQIEAEDNIMPYILTEVRHGVLYIGIKDGIFIQNRKPLRYTVMVPNITLLDVSGSGEIFSADIDTEKLLVDVSGSGKITIEDLATESLGVQISGSGEVITQGEAPEQMIDISGAGSYAASKLKSDNVDVHVSGSGETKLWVTDTLSVDVSGAGDVMYQGNPKISSNMTGAGEVTQITGR
jgi:hypothetical protein